MGGGYDVYSGTETEFEKAKSRVEAAYQQLKEEIRRSWEKNEKQSSD